MSSYRIRRQFRRRWYWLMGRTFWRFYPPAVTRGPLTCWLWKLRHGRPCSDEILRDAWKARRAIERDPLREVAK